MLGLVVGACGDDDDGGGENEELVQAMVSEGATEEQARCFVDELGDDAERMFSAADDELSEDDQEALFSALEECGAFE